MELDISEEFRSICKCIANEQKSLNEWAEIESDDMFQTGSFAGGFDATEMEFTFSFFDESSTEWWFQLPLGEIVKIATGSDAKVFIRKAN